MQTLKFPPNVWREVLQVLTHWERKRREGKGACERDQQGARRTEAAVRAVSTGATPHTMMSQ